MASASRQFADRYQAGRPHISQPTGFEGIAAMRAFVIACIAAAVIATGAAVALYQFQESAADAFSTSEVRI
jgi:Zn-dependent protease with chaperone function